MLLSWWGRRQGVDVDGQACTAPVALTAMPGLMLVTLQLLPSPLPGQRLLQAPSHQLLEGHSGTPQLRLFCSVELLPKVYPNPVFGGGGASQACH